MYENQRCRANEFCKTTWMFWGKSNSPEFYHLCVLYSSSYKQLFLDLNLFYFLSVSIYWHPFLPWGCNLNRKKKGNQQELWQKQSYSNYTEVVKSGTILNRMFKNARTTVLHRRLTSRGGGEGGVIVSLIFAL